MSGSEGPQHSLRFQELPYTIETGEAEMISIDFVAKGGANAAAIEDAKPDTTKPPTPSKDTKGKGKASTSSKKDAQTNGTATKGDLILSAEDEDHIALLTAKANAIRMLQQRIALLRSYLDALPSCYLTQPAHPIDSNTPQVIPADLNLDHQILRQTSALLARLPLLSATTAPPPPPNPTTPASQPTETSTYTTQSLSQSTDVALTSLLSSLGTTLSHTQKLGRKAAVFESARNAKDPERMGMGIGMGMKGSRGFEFDAFGGDREDGEMEEDGRWEEMES